MPLRHLAKVRGTLNQVNGLFQIADGMSAGTSPMITIREAFKVELGISTWKGAIALHAFDPNWSLCSTTRDQIMDVISRARGPVMVIFQLSRRRRSVAEVGFFVAVEGARSGRRLRVMSRALPCSSFTPTVTNDNSDIGMNVQSCDDDNKRSSVGIGYASGGNTAKGLIFQGVQRIGPKTQEQPKPQRLKFQGFKSREGGKSKGLGSPQSMQTSSDNTPKAITVYGIKPQGHKSLGQLMPEGHKPPEFSQRSSGDNAGGIKFPGLREVNSQEFLQSKAYSDYPKGFKSLEVSQEPGGVSSDSSGFKYLALTQAPDGNNAREIILQGLSRDNYEVESDVGGISNANIVVVSDEKEGVLCLSSIKMALPRAMTLTLLGLQNVCMLISIKVNNAASMVWHCLRNICKPVSSILNKAEAVIHRTETKEEQITSVKTTLSERAPINAEDVQSEQNEVVNEVIEVQQIPEKHGGVEDGAAFQIQVAYPLDSKGCTVTHYVCVKEGLTVKRPTNLQDNLPGPCASSCILAYQADICTASSSQNDQGKGTTKEKIEGPKESQDNFGVLFSFNERNEEGDIQDDYLGGFNSQGIKPREFPQEPLDDGPSEEMSRGLHQAQCGSNFNEIKSPSLNGANCEEDDDVCDTSYLYSVVVTDDKRALFLSRFRMAWLRAITLMLHFAQSIYVPNSNELSEAVAVTLSVESEEVHKSGMKKALSEMGPLNAKDIYSEQGAADSTDVKGKENDLQNQGIDGSLAGGPQHYQGNSTPNKEIGETTGIHDSLDGLAVCVESDDDEDCESEPDHLEIEDEDQLDIFLQDAQDLPHNETKESQYNFGLLSTFNERNDDEDNEDDYLGGFNPQGIKPREFTQGIGDDGPSEEISAGLHQTQGGFDVREINSPSLNGGNCEEEDDVYGLVVCVESDDDEDYESEPVLDYLEIEDEDQLDIFLQDAQDLPHNETKESQYNFGLLSTFNERKKDDYLGGFKPQEIKPREFTQGPGGDGPSEEISAGLRQAQGGRNVGKIKSPSLDGDNREVVDDGYGTSKLYSVVVTDDERALCLSRFKMGWLRAITIMLHFAQKHLYA